jgi:3-phenylpropionate/trans-cinnamate dioxygenase ferredoxin reductase subunit
MVGGGFIGLEAAASARSRGAHVTVFEAGPAPLAGLFGVGGMRSPRCIGKTVSTCAATRKTGITDIPTTGVEVICRTEAWSKSTMSSSASVRSPMTRLPGHRKSWATAFASISSVALRHQAFMPQGMSPIIGIRARHRTRVEHFDNAARQAMVAVRNMMGERVEYADVHWFWSDQYEVSLQFAGRSTDWDRMVVRGDIDARDFVVFYLKDDAVVGAFGMDRGGDVMAAKALIAARRSPGDAILANPDARPRPMCLKRKKDPKRKVGQARRRGLRTCRAQRASDRGHRASFHGRGSGTGHRPFGWAGLCPAQHLYPPGVQAGGGASRGRGLTCLCHGSIFELATGIPLNPPATVPVRTFPVIERDGLIYVKVR